MVFCTQLVFSMKCPLTLLNGYLMNLAKPGYANRGPYNPFTIRLLKNVFGFEAPEIITTILLVILIGLGISTFISLRKMRLKYN